MPLGQSAAAMQQSIAKNFQAEGRPGSWQPLKQISLILRTNAGSDAILQDTGRLLASVTTSGGAGSVYELTASHAKIGSNLIYAALQQEGGTVTPKRAKVMARKVTDAQAHAADMMGWPVSYWSGGPHVIFGLSRTIPARPYLVVQDEDVKQFETIFATWLEGGANVP